MNSPFGGKWLLASIIMALTLAGCFGGVRGPQASTGSFDHPVIGKNLVYISGADGYLYALDKNFLGLSRDRRDAPTSGGQIWKVAVGDEEDPQSLVAGPAFDPDRNIVLVGSEDGHLYAFDATDGGDYLWKFPTGNKIWSTPVIRDGIVYFGSHDGNVYAVNLDTQKEKWRYTTGGAVAGRPLLFQDLVVVGSFDKKLYGIDLSSGNKRWELQGDNWFWAGAVADRRTIFAPSMDGNVYAVDSNGQLLWKFDLGSGIVSRPVLIEGTLVVAARKGRNINLLDTSPAPLGENRLIDSRFVGDADIRAPIYAKGNTLYVSTEDGTVTRLNVEASRSGRLILEEVWCFNTEDASEC
ncbi:MAG: PQQ-binding-like beta-propeller repeat protein [Chloroflexi bacterium]|nr:PQQ-binding-like beta-propeller repeat protein [Chloroflexota bacterium]